MQGQILFNSRKVVYNSRKGRILHCCTELNKFCPRTNSLYAFSEAIDLHQEYNLAMLYIFLVSNVLESFLPAITVLVSCYLPNGTLVLMELSVEVVSYFLSGCWLLIAWMFHRWLKLVPCCRMVVVWCWLLTVCVGCHFFHCRCPSSTSYRHL